jgi:hypothetical protein
MKPAKHPRNGRASQCDLNWEDRPDRDGIQIARGELLRVGNFRLLRGSFLSGTTK